MLLLLDAIGASSKPPAVLLADAGLGGLPVTLPVVEFPPPGASVAAGLRTLLLLLSAAASIGITPGAGSGLTVVLLPLLLVLFATLPGTASGADSVVAVLLLLLLLFAVLPGTASGADSVVAVLLLLDAAGTNGAAAVLF